MSWTDHFSRAKECGIPEHRASRLPLLPCLAELVVCFYYYTLFTKVHFPRCNLYISQVTRRNFIYNLYCFNKIDSFLLQISVKELLLYTYLCWNFAVSVLWFNYLLSPPPPLPPQFHLSSTKDLTIYSMILIFLLSKTVLSNKYLGVCMYHCVFQIPLIPVLLQMFLVLSGCNTAVLAGILFVMCSIHTVYVEIFLDCTCFHYLLGEFFFFGISK